MMPQHKSWHCCKSTLLILFQEPTPEKQASPQNIITIAYESGWRQVMMHYSADGQGSAPTYSGLNLCAT
jgi:hypothetical protein